MSRMAGVAAPFLGATQQAVMSQMQKYSQIEDKKQQLNDSRALERERIEDISKRNNVAELEPEENAPSEQSVEVREYKKVVDTATKEEIDLFAFALSLGSALADRKIISDSTDIVRPDDFSGDTLRELVRIFLNIFDGNNETLFARMSDYFSKLTINGMPAEDVMLRAVESADKTGNVEIKRDMYLALLLKVRTTIINREEERLMSARVNCDEVGKAKIDEALRRLSDYKLTLRNRIGEL
jgi:hypothetical protein